MFVLGNSLGGMCAVVQDRMPIAIMVCSTASANQAASATTGFSAATLPHLLIAVLAIAGVMAMGDFSSSAPAFQLRPSRTSALYQ